MSTGPAAVSRAAPAGETSGTSARLTLGLLFLVVTLNLADRQIVNILAQDIKLDLGLSDAELGLLTGTAFGIFKAAVSIPVAWWADRLDRAKMLAVLLATWSAFTVACGFAGSFLALFIGRVGVGIGESGGQPVTTALVRDHFPARPTSAIAAMMAGNPLGAFLAFLGGGAIAQLWGWQAAFIAAGLPGLLLVPVILRKLKDPRPRRIPPGAARPWLADTVRLARSPGMPWLIAATFASMFIVNSANAWLPAYFIRVHGVSTGEMGVYGAFAIGIGGGLGTLSGLFCERLRGRIAFPESALMLVTLGLLVPTLWLVVLVPDRRAALAGLFLLDFLAYAWLAPTIRLIQDAAGTERRSLAIATCGGIAIFIGLGFGLPLTGWLSDLLTPVYGAASIGYALCVIIPAAALAGLASHGAVLRRLAAASTDKSPS